jgi:hypothetical protein
MVRGRRRGRLGPGRRGVVRWLSGEIRLVGEADADERTTDAPGTIDEGRREDARRRELLRAPRSLARRRLQVRVDLDA